jgi:hypothetical protein
MADLMEDHMPALMGLAVREAGKTLSNAIAEVREAVDFCRYYAAQIVANFDNATHQPLGPVVCISPWNFPLAIFIGEVTASLAAGNPVLAKPAEQTNLIAAYAVRLLHEAGVPRDVLQLLPGRGEIVGAALTSDPRIHGVIFTGSTEVAQIINRTLAKRGEDVVLVAETGGQNAMIVDSSAAGAGGDRCAELGLRFGRSALLRLARAVSAKRYRRQGDRHDQGCHGRTDRGQPGQAEYRCRPGDRCRSPGRPAGTHRQNEAACALVLPDTADGTMPARYLCTADAV